MRQPPWGLNQPPSCRSTSQQLTELPLIIYALGTTHTYLQGAVLKYFTCSECMHSLLVAIAMNSLQLGSLQFAE